MQLSQILSMNRIAIDKEGTQLTQGPEVLARLSEMLASDGDCDAATVLKLLIEREHLLSTGIGDGVAIPHTPVPGLVNQKAALVLCPQGVEFAAIDQQPVKIFFAVIGPKSAASEHLKILARLSRLLKSPETRRRLLESTSSEQAYSLIQEQEAAPP
jgi:nitrogen PTS system EIIA component